MNDELSLKRRRLRLSIEIIQAIEEELFQCLDRPDTPLERIHGSFTVEIVKGQFQRVQVARSSLLIDQQSHKRNIA